MSAPAACRAFENALAERLDAHEGLASALAADSHSSSCASCRALVDTLRVTSEELSWLHSPAPARGFEGRLLAIPRDLEDRIRTAHVLELLRPGALLSPEPSTEFLAGLHFLPARLRASRSAADVAPPPIFSIGFLRSLFGDWRFGVAAAYAATLLIVTLMKVDPLSVAQDAASDLTAVGERAIASARQVAVSRIDTSSLTKRLDYRLYRAAAASRARAVAYSQLVFEKVLGGAFQQAADAKQPAPRPTREPPDRALRS